MRYRARQIAYYKPLELKLNCTFMSYLFYEDNFIFVVFVRDKSPCLGGSQAVIATTFETLTRWQMEHLAVGALVSRKITNWVEICTLTVDVAILTKHPRSTNRTKYLVEMKT